MPGNTGLHEATVDPGRFWARMRLRKLEAIVAEQTTRNNLVEYRCMFYQKMSCAILAHPRIYI